MSAYRIDLRHMGRTELGILVALYCTQPATNKLVAVTCGLSARSLSPGFKHLRRCGLLKRNKATKGNLNGGRRPWVYRLTGSGHEVAEHLWSANGALLKAGTFHPQDRFLDR